MNPLLELVRAPAALTVLGDTLAGAGDRPLTGRRLLLPASSVAFYWAGMALNDYADRELDRRERPERPIPSGRIRPGTALATAAGLTGAGLGLAGLAGGRRTVRRALPLAVAVWAYDLALKATPAGPVAMAACRALDVRLGAGPGSRPGPAAAALAGHTLGLTLLSRAEVPNPGARCTASARLALAGTVTAALTACAGPARSRGHRLAGLLAALGFVRLAGRWQLAAARRGNPATVRAATAAGIHGMLPLQSAMLARAGSLPAAVLLTLALPVASRLGRRVSPT
jgi:UbiA prenyltransferase family